MAEDTQSPEAAPVEAATTDPATTAPVETSAAPVAPEAAPESAIQRIEDEAKAAIERVEAAVAPSNLATAVNTAIDEFWGDVFQNVSPLIPTTIHNTLNGFKEALRSKILGLI